MITTKKRQRGENWLREDKITLKELVRERVRVIENKNTDTNSNSLKVAAWNDIRESFNGMCKGAQRSVSQLKAQWGILKIQAKKVKASERKELHKSGGGAPPVLEVVNSEDISSWFPNKFTIDCNEFDSDQINPILSVETTAYPPPPPTPSASGPPADLKEKINVKTNPPPPMASRSCPANIRKKIYRNKITSPAEQISNVEIECRRELHAIQMDNENQKKQNLKLKEILLKEMIKYYQNKNK